VEDHKVKVVHLVETNVRVVRDSTGVARQKNGEVRQRASSKVHKERKWVERNLANGDTRSASIVTELVVVVQMATSVLNGAAENRASSGLDLDAESITIHNVAPGVRATGLPGPTIGGIPIATKLGNNGLQACVSDSNFPVIPCGRIVTNEVGKCPVRNGIPSSRGVIPKRNVVNTLFKIPVLLISSRVERGAGLIGGLRDGGGKG